MFAWISDMSDVRRLVDDSMHEVVAVITYSGRFKYKRNAVLHTR